MVPNDGVDPEPNIGGVDLEPKSDALFSAANSFGADIDSPELDKNALEPVLESPNSDPNVAAVAAAAGAFGAAIPNDDIAPNPVTFLLSPPAAALPNDVKVDPNPNPDGAGALGLTLAAESTNEVD